MQTDEPMGRCSYDDLFAQPFAAYIIRGSSSCSSKVLDLSFLSDTEHESLMSWIYAAGWDILTESRMSITVDPEARLPPRIWVPLGATATTPTRTRRRPATIPRFCRHGRDCPDKDTTCHYTHDDTIHCINEICAFDNPAEGGCCASTDKRKTCIRVHPSEGQIWSPELVVHRP